MFKAGVTIGDPVLRTGKPLSVELGPGEVFVIYTVAYMQVQSVSYMYQRHRSLVIKCVKLTLYCKSL